MIEYNPQNTPLLNKTGNFYLSKDKVDKDGRARITSGLQATITVIAALPYTISGQQSFVIKNGQYVTVQLTQKTFSVLDGSL